MIQRFLAKLIISSRLDTGRPLPRWVQRLVDRDSHVAQFYEQTHRLAGQLRQSADAWGDAAMPSRAPENVLLDHPAVDRESGRNASSVTAWLALGACLLIAVGWWGWHWYTEDSIGEGTRQAGGRGKQVVDLRPVLASLSAGEKVYRQVSDGAKSVFSQTVELTELPALASPMRTSESARQELRHAGQRFNGAMHRLASALAAATPESGTEIEPSREP